jgi:hypothetical protein
MARREFGFDGALKLRRGVGIQVAFETKDHYALLLETDQVKRIRHLCRLPRFHSYPPLAHARGSDCGHLPNRDREGRQAASRPYHQ